MKVAATGHEEQITIVDYRSKQPSVNSRIRLQQHLFSFLMEGEKVVFYAGRKVRIQPNQFLLLSAGNCLMSEKLASGNGRYRSVLFFFDNRLVGDFLARHPIVESARTRRVAEEPVLVFDKDPFLINFVQSLVMLLEKGPIAFPMKAVKLEELLLYLRTQYPNQLRKLRDVSGDGDEDLRLKQAVTEHLENPISVEELAFLCNTSLSTFKRRFAKIYGTSPNKWLLDKRMRKAALLLKQGEHKASDIYFDLGYKNLSSFVQSFKQVYGVTPKQYQLAN